MDTTHTKPNNMPKMQITILEQTKKNKNKRGDNPMKEKTQQTIKTPVEDHNQVNFYTKTGSAARRQLLVHHSRRRHTESGCCRFKLQRERNNTRSQS
jgi:hypothetical protein